MGVMAKGVLGWFYGKKVFWVGFMGKKVFWVGFMEKRGI